MKKKTMYIIEFTLVLIVIVIFVFLYYFSISQKELLVKLSSDKKIAELCDESVKVEVGSFNNALKRAIQTDSTNLDGDFYLYVDKSSIFKNKYIIDKKSGLVYSTISPKANIYFNDSTYTNKLEFDKNASGNNPLKGLAPHAKEYPWKGSNQKINLAYIGLEWKDFEPLEGQYNYKLLDETYHVPKLKESGVKLVLRVICDMPNSLKQATIPDWLFNKINADGTWYGTKEYGGFSPNYKNDTVINAHKKLIEALANYFKDKNILAFIELGSIGHYGEWHIAAISDQAMPPQEIQEEYVSHYRNNFKDIKLMFRRPFNTTNYTKDGFYNDMMGADGYTTEWLGWIKDHSINDKTTFSNFWNYSPSGGEFAYGDPYSILDNSNFDKIIIEVQDAHTTFIGPCTPTYGNTDEQRKNANILTKNLGYRFYIPEVTTTKIFRAGDNSLSIKLSNLGNSPFYYDWEVGVSLIDDNAQEVFYQALDIKLTDITTSDYYELNTTVNVPSNLPIGPYALAFSIRDPITNKPAVATENTSLDANNLTHLYNIFFHP